jgi:hypothetical protein
LSGRTAAAQARAEMATRNLMLSTAEFKAAEATRAGRERADKQLLRFYDDVLPRDQAGARRITYLRLARLADDANLDYDRRSVATKQDRDSQLQRMDMVMVLSGEYADVRRFIHRSS